MSKCYPKYPCFLCGKRVSKNGLALSSHNRKHVREGLMRETAPHDRDYPYLVFELTDEGRGFIAKKADGADQ